MTRPPLVLNLYVSHCLQEDLWREFAIAKDVSSLTEGKVCA